LSYLNDSEIKNLKFARVGINVLVSSKTSIYNPELIEIGDNSRIDDFCSISGKVIIGKNVHIASHSIVIGGIEGITLEDFSGVSFGCKIFSSSDDYSGEFLTNPTIPEEFKSVTRAPIKISKHAIVGTNSVIFPGVIIEEGCAIAAMSLVNKNTTAWGIYAGIPARRIKDRSRELLVLESEYIKEFNQ
jgi:acetyltransferase-like isoleucine patch superfamily enzyme